MAQVSKLTIDSSKIAADLTDYPVYVNLADLPSSFWDTVADGGGDIRIFKSDGTTELPREVVSCDTSTETGELHFKYTGTLSSTVDTEIQIHADGTSADYATDATYGAENVWTGYKGVWHTADNSKDSTSGGFDGTDSNITYTTGQIEKGAEFNGTSSQISLGNVGVSGSTARTVSGWIKTDVVNTSLDAIFTYGANTDNALCSLLINTVNNGDLYWAFSSNDYRTNGGVISTDTWYYINAVYDGGTLSTSTVRLYLNSTAQTLTKVGAATGAANTTDSNYAIGYDKGVSGRNFDGILDEIRIANVALSSDWITTEYNNQNSPSTFYTATEPGVNIESPTLSITATLNTPTLAFENPLSISAPTLAITATLNAPTISLVNPVTIAPPTLEMTLTMLSPRKIKVGLVSNIVKHTTTATNRTKHTATVKNRNKS